MRIISGALTPPTWSVDFAYWHNPDFPACPLFGRYQSQSRHWDPTAPLIMGVDIARQGADHSVIRFRRGLDAR